MFSMSCDYVFPFVTAAIRTALNEMRERNNQFISQESR